MTTFQRYVLRKVFAKLFIQGPSHHRNAAEIFKLAREVWEDEFIEDNSYTVDAMLREAFEATQFAPSLNNEDVQQLRKAIKDDNQKT